MRTKDAVIRVRALDGGWETIGVDRLAGISAEGLEQQWDRWGPSLCTFDLKRSPRATWPDIAAYTDVEIEVGGVQNWKGRVRGTPARDGADRSMSVQCVGLQMHLDDDAYYPVYVHSRTADWKDIRSQIDSSLSTFVTRPRISNDRGAISMGWAKDDIISTGQAVGVTLDLGPKASGLAKRIVVDYDTIGLAPASNFKLAAVGHSLPGQPTTSTGAATAADFFVSLYAGGGFPTSGTFSGTITTAARCVTLYLIATANNTATVDFTFRAKAIRVFTDTAYESGGLSVLKASTVVMDALSKATLLLDADRSLVQATSFSIPDLSSLQGRTAREVIQGVNAFHDYTAKVDERGRPVFAPQAAAPTMEVGEYTALEGTDASQNNGDEIFNRAILEATSPSGDPLVFDRAQAQQSGAPLIAVSTPAFPNPSFATNTTGWGTTGGTLTRTTTVGEFDSTPAGGKWNNGYLAVLFTTLTGTFTRGTTYVFRFRARASVGTPMDVYLGGPPYVPHTRVVLTTSVQTFDIAWTPTVDTTNLDFLLQTTLSGFYDVFVDTFELYTTRATLVDRRGFVRTKTLQITSPLGSDGTAANQILDAYLLTHRAAAFAGDYEITGSVREPVTGKLIPPEQVGMRTTELLCFMDRTDPDTGAVGRNGRVVGAKYRLDTDTVQVSIDSTSQNFEAALARLGALQGS